MEYTVGGIVLPAITPFTQVVDCGLLPAGVYTVTTNGVLNSSVTSTQISTLTVNSCCPAAAAFTGVTDVCVGDSISLINTGSGYTGQSWYEDNVLVGTGVNYGIVASSIGSFTYKLVVTDGSCDDSTEMVVNVLAPAAISSATVDLTPVCPGELVTFTGVSTRGYQP